MTKNRKLKLFLSTHSCCSSFLSPVTIIAKSREISVLGAGPLFGTIPHYVHGLLNTQQPRQNCLGRGARECLLLQFHDPDASTLPGTGRRYHFGLLRIPKIHELHTRKKGEILWVY